MSNPTSPHRTGWHSWPPTQVRLHPSIEQDDAEIGDLDLSYIDDDPLNFFLTTAPLSEDDDIDMMDFDAGIEDAKRPAPIVRSVSPSSLDSGLSRLPLCPPTPPRGPGSPFSEPDVDMAPTPEDNDSEEYLGFGSSPESQSFSSPLSLKDFANARTKARKHKESKTATVLLSPMPLHISCPTATGRGRLTHRPSPRPLSARSLRGVTRSSSARSSPHAWREPSPDVWAIEEETEEELNSEMGNSSMVGENKGQVNQTTQAIDVPTAKSKKKVRFVLPGREVPGH